MKRRHAASCAVSGPSIRRMVSKKEEADLEKRLKRLTEETATPVLQRTKSRPLTPRPPGMPARPATNIPLLADEGKPKKTSGKGLKYKKTPKKLLMLGSAHAGNNNKKMLKMLKRKK